MMNKKLLTLVVVALGFSTALACSWSYWTDHSVRFNSMRTGRGFYRLPPLPIQFDTASGKERSQAEVENYDDFDTTTYEERQLSDAKPDKVWEEVLMASSEKELPKVRKGLIEYLELTKYGANSTANFDQNRRNVASDILDAIGELGHGASIDGVANYIAVRIGIQEGTISPDSILTADSEFLPELNGNDRSRLGDNWAYLRAAALYARGRKDEAEAAFRDHAAKFPTSEKNEAALYMIGRIAVESSHATTTDDCGIQGEDWEGKAVTPADPNECRDEKWRSAMDRFKLLLSKHPNGRYANDARGWIAFLHKRGGERAEALAEYYRLLGQTSDPQWRLEAKKSLQMIGHDYDDATLDKVEALISNEPDAALAYAYHRIYNHSVDLSYAEINEWCCYGDDKWTAKAEEAARVRKSLDSGRHELERVAKFSTAMVKRYGSNRVSADFLLRIAQAQLELQNFDESLAFADRSIAAGVAADLRAQALWVKGSSEHGSKKLDKARLTLTRLVAEYPAHRLTEGSRRLLAITAEDQGDLEFALDQYVALKYQYDIAYFVDILLPVERLAKYLEARNNSPMYNELRYALGVRYLRERRWEEARVILRTIRTEPAAFDPYEDDARARRPRFPKIPEWDSDDKPAFIRDTWVLRDLKTADALEQLERTVDLASGGEAKAEAMYQLASYYFESSALLLYNPSAWDGARYQLLSDFHGSVGKIRDEDRLIFDHFQSHDTLARAIPIYLEIVDRFPETSTAKDAFYSAAVAHERLSDLNPYWREIYGKGLFAGPRRVDYSDVRRKYPNYQLPKATYGWEPSTRTVNGGPGWSPKPKPLPKLTIEQRVVRKLEKWVDKYGETVWDKAAAAKDGAKDVASSVSGALVGYLQKYYYLVYTGFLGAIFWANRKEIYEGPVTKGSFLAHRGLVILAKHFREWWVAVAVPSVIRVSSSEVPSAPEKAAQPNGSDSPKS